MRIVGADHQIVFVGDFQNLEQVFVHLTGNVHAVGLEEVGRRFVAHKLAEGSRATDNLFPSLFPTGLALGESRCWDRDAIEEQQKDNPLRQALPPFCV
jgi:hypothetical protein